MGFLNNTGGFERAVRWRAVLLAGVSLVALAAAANLAIAQTPRPAAAPGGAPAVARPGFMPPDSAFDAAFRADADKAVAATKPRPAASDKRSFGQQISDNNRTVDNGTRELAAKYPLYPEDSIRRYLVGKVVMLGALVVVPEAYVVPEATPVDIARANQAVAYADAMTRAVEGFRAMAQQAILTNNPALVQIAENVLLAYHGALQTMAIQSANVTQVDPALKTLLDRIYMRALAGTLSAVGAIFQIDEWQAGRRQQAQAPAAQPAGTQVVRAPPPSGNTIVPADPLKTPMTCGGDLGMCTGDPGDTVIAGGPDPGDLRINLGDYCGNSGACTPGPNGSLQFPWAGPGVRIVIPPATPPPAATPNPITISPEAIQNAIAIANAARTANVADYLKNLPGTVGAIVDVLPPELRIPPTGDPGSAGAINSYILGSEFISPGMLNGLSGDLVLSPGQKIALDILGNGRPGAIKFLQTDQLVGQTIYGNAVRRAGAEQAFRIPDQLRQGILGGPIIRDRLWFFTAGRGPSTTSGPAVTQTELERIPTARDPWVILQQTPGLLTDRMDFGVGDPPPDSGSASTLARDTLSYGNFTLDLGLRYDLPGSITDTLKMDGDSAPAVASKDPGFDWATISPRLGLTYALGAERKTLLRASYSRFADQLGTGVGSWLNPLALGSYAYFYHQVAEPPRGLTQFPITDTLRIPQLGQSAPTDTFNKRLANRWMLRGNFFQDDWQWDVTTTETGNLPQTYLGKPGETGITLPEIKYKLSDTSIFKDDFYLKGLQHYIGGGYRQIVPPSATQGGVYQPFIEIPMYRNSFQIYPVDRPANQSKLDASTFFNTGKLSHELIFGAGYRQAQVESLSTWSGMSYQQFDGPPVTEARTPEISFWAGQRFYRRTDVHITDYFTWSNPPGSLEIAQPLTIQAARPNDPLASSRGAWQQAHDDQWALKAINWMKDDGSTVLPERGRPVTVAVIDTGLDLTHPELFGAVWVNPVEPRAAPAPGLVRNPMKARWIGWNFLEQSADIRDFNGHGTIVAGIIAANVNDGIGMAGLNPWARIMPLKVADHRGRTDTIATAKAIVFAVQNGARVINLSLGGNKLSETVKRAIDYAASKNVLVVVAAGNEGVDVKSFTPAAFASTIAVAAVGPDLKRAQFSNWGQNLTVAAPGVDVLSLRAAGTDLLQFARTDYKPGSAIVNGRYYRVDGTSFAAPMVAGVASLILSQRPELSAEQVRRMILQSARDIEEPGRDQYSGYGLLDAEAALKADPSFFVEAAIDDLGVVAKGGKQVVRVTGTARADKLKASWIEIGQGESPRTWKKVTANATRGVERGAIGDIDAAALAGAKVWTLRVIVEHQNGRQREGRYRLTLG